MPGAQKIVLFFSTSRTMCARGAENLRSETRLVLQGLLSCSPKSVGRAFAKPFPIFNSETAKMIESQSHRDLGNLLLRLGEGQQLSNFLKSCGSDISHWRYALIISEVLEQGASWNCRRHHDFRQRNLGLKVRVNVFNRPLDVAWKDGSFETPQSLRIIVRVRQKQSNRDKLLEGARRNRIA